MAIALAFLPVVVLVATWIGFFNVGASTGHWKITEWFLHFAMRSAVRTYALAVEVPDRLPHDGVQPAAGHFARGCAICHGAPGEPRSPAALAMLPQPPDLAQAVGEWEDAELFRLVKHGVRFTGMPAWPTQARDDEVWAMVAFLRELPTMDAARYRDLAYGSGRPPPSRPVRFEDALAECSRCHGSDGLGRSPSTPVIAGQNEAYLLASLRAYAEARRPSGMMQLPTVAIDPAQMQALAKHFAALPPRNDSVSTADAKVSRRGEEIARRGLPLQKVPACLGCHGGPDRNPAYPRLEGQSAAYMTTQLRLFRNGQRGGTRFSHLMESAAKRLSDADIASVAAFFSSLRPPVATHGP
ncbi:c-type cytochrome [Mesorhizobium sp. LHD-90]|uniref:c-type cytochrome n=1 Tax=Mesorhizobium sp. LHD-90 TaxID=3071414 RepID=UPI0027E02A21|nr:c-type cytochrome [Mesorhizobium sp. LHD-90]MDQ6432735.1 c-type cytochrome [Mesorhizobium sp. LHD-90]